MQDRDYYRSLTPERLLLTAREEGINPEMAIAIAEALAETLGDLEDVSDYEGVCKAPASGYTFNYRSVTK